MMSFLALLLSLAAALRPGLSTELSKHTRYAVDVLRNRSDTNAIRIAASVSLRSSSTFASAAKDMARAWDMFSKWVNLERGGIWVQGKNRPVSITLAEDYSNKSEVSSVYEDLLPEFDFYLAPYSSGLTDAAADVTDPAGKLMVTSASSASYVFENRTSTFGTVPPNIQYLESSMGAFSYYGAKSVAVLKDIDYAGCDSVEDSLATAVKYNLTLYGFFPLDPTSPTYSQELYDLAGRFKNASVQTILGCTYSPMCYEIINSFKAVDYNPHALSVTNCIDSDVFVGDVTTDARGFMMPTPWDKSLDIVDEYTGWTPTEFSQRYKDAYDHEPTYIAANSFSSAEIIMASIEHTDSLDPLVLSEAIKVLSFPTIYANVTFDENNQIESPMIIVQQQRTDTFNLVYPYVPEGGSVLYPMPTWKTKACEKETSDCSGHGQCNGNGTCVCDPGYYGKTNVKSCDAVCDGILADDVARDITFCKHNATYQIAGVVEIGASDAQELAAMMRLAVELINNKTDGFFDDIAPQVFFELTEDQWECSEEAGAAGISRIDGVLRNATNATSAVLAALVGPPCSSGSDGASSYADRNIIPQMSFASTLAEFSDKNNFAYFARTCPSDKEQANYLSEMLKYLNLTNVTVVSISTDKYSSSIANLFIDTYLSDSTRPGNVLLHESYPVGSEPLNASDYEVILNSIAASGAPAIALVTTLSETTHLFEAISRHPEMSSDKYVWLGVNDWMKFIDLNFVREGSLGIAHAPINASQPVTAAFMELWKSLDPEQYPDYDGDRSTLTSYSGFAVDAVISMAIAYQATIDINFVGTESERRQVAYEQLLSMNPFDGVSGKVALDANGDRDLFNFELLNFQNIWKTFGTVAAVINEQSTIDIDVSQITWPNGNTGAAGTLDYSIQYSPVCPPGKEPDTKGSTYYCDACPVGTYKPYIGGEECMPCPEGTDCNNVGIIVPCILPGYWRPQPPEGEEGDFGKWSVFRCDMTRRCEGGCQLNATCAANVKQTSPVCGVCEDGYYASGESCDVCPPEGSGWEVGEIIIASIVCFIALVAFVAHYVINLRCEVGEEYFSGHQTGGHKESDKLHSEKGSSVVAVLGLDGQNSSEFLFVTLKLGLSFIQVLVGTLPRFRVEWGKNLSFVVASVGLSPTQYFPVLTGCNGTDHLRLPFAHILLVFLLPFAFLAVTFIVRRMIKLVLQVGYSHVARDRSDAVSSALNASTVSTAVWFCIFCFPFLASGTFGYFDCRDMGVIGSYMREDYSVRCDDNPTYSGFLVLAVLCVLLYPVGIPLFYYVLIRDREKEWAHVGSTPLHQNFLPEWAYFEVFELFRKLLLTSVVAFVKPGTVTQCNYVFVVNVFFLLVLSACRPYISDADDLLSRILILTECVVFYLLSIVLSGVYSTDNYDKHSILSACGAVILTALLLFIPVNLASKIPSTHRLLNTLSERAAELAAKAGIKVTRLWKLDARSRYEDEVEALRESVASRNSDMAGIEGLQPLEAEESGFSRTNRPGSGRSTRRPFSRRISRRQPQVSTDGISMTDFATLNQKG